MKKSRVLAIISIIGLMVLAFSGMAGAIGFTYTDTTTNASGSGINYTLSVDGAGKGTLTVTGGLGTWDLVWVEFKLAGVKLGDDKNGFFRVEVNQDLGGDTLTIKDLDLTALLSAGVPDPEEWSLKAGYIGPDAGKSGKAQTDQLSVSVPVPEPGTLLLLGSGLLGLAGFGFFRSRRKR